ncbi:MAG: ATP-binding protein [Bacillota bacterium]
MKDLSLHILDIVQNSTAAGADCIKVTIRAQRADGVLEIEVEDDGCGMDGELLARVTDPFATTRATRKVGLGIPLLKASAERSGGSFRIVSQKGTGTTVKADFQLKNIDRPPMGDVAGVIADLAAAYPEIDIQLLLKCGERIFRFSSLEVRQIIGEVPVSELRIMRWMRRYIEEGIWEIFGGVIDEIDSGTRRNSQENTG